MSPVVFGGSDRKRNFGETSAARTVKKIAGSNSCPSFRAERNSATYDSTSSCATGRRNARGRNAFRISRAACSGVVPLPGFATRIRSRDLYSLAATSVANLAACMYFSDNRGERNSVSPALSKPSPPAPSAGSMLVMSTCMSSRSRMVAAYSSRFSRRTGGALRAVVFAQPAARTDSAIHLTNGSRCSAGIAGAPFGGISAFRTRTASMFHRAASDRRVEGVAICSRSKPAAAFDPEWQPLQREFRKCWASRKEYGADWAARARGSANSMPAQRCKWPPIIALSSLAESITFLSAHGLGLIPGLQEEPGPIVAASTAAKGPLEPKRSSGPGERRVPSRHRPTGIESRPSAEGPDAVLPGLDGGCELYSGRLRCGRRVQPRYQTNPIGTLLYVSRPGRR